MTTLYLAVYTTPLAEKTGYRWLWQHPKIPDQLLGVFYSKIKKPTDVARWSSDELHAGLASVDSEWCAAYRFLHAGRDALGRQGRVFLIAGFLRANELPQLDLRRALESPLFSTPLDSPPQCMELDLSPVATRYPDDLLRRLRDTSTVEVVGVEQINQLAGACAQLGSRRDFSLQVNGEPTRLICTLSVSPSAAVQPKPNPLSSPTAGSATPQKTIESNPPATDWKWVFIAATAGLIIGGVIGYRIGRHPSRTVVGFPPPVPEYQSEALENPPAKSKIPPPIPAERPSKQIERPSKPQPQPADH